MKDSAELAHLIKKGGDGNLDILILKQIRKYVEITNTGSILDSKNTL
jgi:hypothetical protein